MIGVSGPRDLPHLEQIYSAAFPEEDLVPLVRELLTGDFGCLSLVHEQDGAVLGHALFTPCTINGCSVALLGPLAVMPAVHSQGIGSALIKDGAARLKKTGFAAIFLLGDPNYYSRFGFVRAEETKTPQPIPDEWLDAWQVLRLDEGAELGGQMAVPSPWDMPQHWQPVPTA